MDSSTQAVSALRQRMIDDMRMCKLGEKTQLQYIRAVRRLAAFLGRPPNTATIEGLRRYQTRRSGTPPHRLDSTRSRRARVEKAVTR